MDDQVTVSEAARLLGVDGATIRRRLERGIMQGERVHARLWFIPRAEVDRWQGRGKLAPGPKPRGEPSPGKRARSPRRDSLAGGDEGQERG